MTRRAVFHESGVYDDGAGPLSFGSSLPDPSAVPDGRWLRTASGAAVWQAATTADLPDSTNKRYVTDAQLVVIGNTSGLNSGDQSTVSGNAGTATALQTSRNIDGQAFNGTADITVIAPGTHAATSKATPVDADEVSLVDSAASNVLKKLTWLNLKATLKTYFDTLYAAVGSTGGYATIKDEGGSLTARTIMDFVGAGVTAVDDSGNSKTVITIPGSVASAFTQLANTTLGAPAANIDFTSISGSYNHLLLVTYLRTTRVATNDSVNIRFNNDSTAVYYEELIQALGAALVGAESLAATAGDVGNVPAASGTALRFGTTLTLIPAYANATNHKSWLTFSVSPHGTTTGTIMLRHWGGVWGNATPAAISRVTLIPATGTNFATGSQATLYGLL